MTEIFQEIDEDIRRERYQKLWKKYGKYFIGSIITFIILAASYIAWQNYAENIKKNEVLFYESAVKLHQEESWNKSINKLEQFSSSSSGYYSLSKFMLASTLINIGKTSEAIEVYEKMKDDNKIDQVFRELAAFNIILNNFDNLSNLQLQERLSPFLNEASPWFYSAQELEAFRLINIGKKSEAKAIILSLSNNSEAPSGIRSRAAELLMVID